MSEFDDLCADDVREEIREETASLNGRTWVKEKRTEVHTTHFGVRLRVFRRSGEWRGEWPGQRSLRIESIEATRELIARFVADVSPAEAATPDPTPEPEPMIDNVTQLHRPDPVYRRDGAARAIRRVLRLLETNKAAAYTAWSDKIKIKDKAIEAAEKARDTALDPTTKGRKIKAAFETACASRIEIGRLLDEVTALEKAKGRDLSQRGKEIGAFKRADDQALQVGDVPVQGDLLEAKIPAMDWATTETRQVVLAALYKLDADGHTFDDAQASLFEAMVSAPIDPLPLTFTEAEVSESGDGSAGDGDGMVLEDKDIPF